MKQTQKTLYSLLGFAVAAAGIGLYAYYGIFEHDKKEDAAKEKSEKLFAPSEMADVKVDAGRIDAKFSKIKIEIKAGDSTTLERDAAGEWQIKSPIVTRVDKLTVDAVTSALQNTKFKKTVDDNPDAAALTKYGLDVPDFTLTADAEAGSKKTSVILKGGIDNTYDNSVFMMRNDEKKVYAAEAGIKWQLRKTLFDLRKKEIAPFETKDVTAIEVTRGKEKYALKKKSSSQWFFDGANAPEADAMEISNQLTSLASERASTFEGDTVENRKKLNVDKPELVLAFTLESGKTATLSFSVVAPPAPPKPPKAKDSKAKEVESPTPPKQYYVLTTTDTETLLATTTMNALSHFDKPATSFRDRRIAVFNATDITRIRVSKSGATFEAQLTTPDAGSDFWSMTLPKPQAAQTAKIANYLYSLVSLRGDEPVIDGAKDLKTKGLDTAQATEVNMYTADGKSAAQFWVGKALEKKKTRLYVMTSKKEVFEVEDAKLRDLPKSADDWAQPPAAPTSDGGTKTMN